MSLKLSIENIKAEASNLGFSACGVAKVAPVEKDVAEVFMKQLNSGGFADMEYMKQNVDKRLNPLLLMPEAKTMVCVALNYAPSVCIAPDEYQIAAYAYGKDYHDVVKTKLHQLAARLNLQNYRAFCDTAPILERYWAWKAGIGVICRNHQLSVYGVGQQCFLGEIICDAEEECGLPLNQSRLCDATACHACQSACPTKALMPDGSFDARKCLSYQTIENKGEIPLEIASKLGNSIYGCDRCLKVCPYNKGVEPTTENQFNISEELLQMKKSDWQNLTEEQFRRLFKGSAVKRVKYSGLMRNIKCQGIN
ncbi:MAG: tRNA epoxyqueuosine(34) reductase QueG [Prevotellaceae bacterium]|nr:tRNA epoxyqueuosine(34) reductase QueG [Prevotellaceae bacterium]